MIGVLESDCFPRPPLPVRRFSPNRGRMKGRGLAGPWTNVSSPRRRRGESSGNSRLGSLRARSAGSSRATRASESSVTSPPPRCITGATTRPRQSSRSAGALPPVPSARLPLGRLGACCRTRRAVASPRRHGPMRGGRAAGTSGGRITTRRAAPIGRNFEPPRAPLGIPRARTCPGPRGAPRPDPLSRHRCARSTPQHPRPALPPAPATRLGPTRAGTEGLA